MMCTPWSPHVPDDPQVTEYFKDTEFDAEIAPAADDWELPSTRQCNLDDDQPCESCQ